MSDRASNNGTPPPISQTPPPIVQIEVVIQQPPIIAISPREWTELELAAVVQRCITKVLFSFLFGNKGPGSIKLHMWYGHNAYAYADNYAQ